MQINYTDNLMNHKLLMFPIFVQECNLYLYFTVDSKRKHVMIDIKDKLEDVNQVENDALLQCVTAKYNFDVSLQKCYKPKTPPRM